jgi:phage gp36-like protein
VPFASRADLLARANAQRLAQLAVPADYEFPPDPQALRRVIESPAALDAFEGDDRAGLVLALDAIDRALADAGQLLISYGIPPEVQTGILARLASIVALYYLQGAERMTDEIEKAYQEVIKLLDRYRKGELPGLVPDDALDAPASGLVLIESAPKRYR